MGKGDIKSKKGKIANGSFGNSRKKRADKVAVDKPEAAAKPAKAAKK